MAAQVLFDGQVNVHYRFINVHGVEDEPGSESDDHRRGQRNGLCGAAVPGMLHLVTGLHTGDVGFRIELHSTEPPLSDTWEEAVEVSFHASTDEMGLHAFDDLYEFTLPPGDYRVRYCARGMQQGHDEDTLAGDEPIDFYLLQFWPGSPAPDRILRQTSDAAAYWHREGRDVELPPGERDAEERHLAAKQEEYDRARFGDRIPNDRLRNVKFHAPSFRALDENLMWALAAADDELHRAVARWAALRALSIAELTDNPIVAPAVAALQRGEHPPFPFDEEAVPDFGAIGDQVPDGVLVPRLPWFRDEPGGDRPQKRAVAALYAVTATNNSDSLGAALHTVETTATAYGGDEYGQFLADLWDAFPQLRAGNQSRG
ncbi:hypothetical protein EV385_3127 [Krasilnikovia cinnamomea]|uniref:Uncharacterized protein n=1 Tax=Krasilnikovia cinnamomea TaxID=349313 RepID=A0A4Q7ZK63_9ACTN|nr:hypothetical protein [Krasilnikovia cinnamomea]RZU51312.1 hypothetical protein EV385_3127 [Krasilnikovia cinnamomea]